MQAWGRLSFAGLAAIAVALAGPGAAAARTWTMETTPAPSGVASSGLDAVSCASANACMAVGTSESPSSQTPGYTDQPFAERSDGTGWTLVDMPAPTGSRNVAMTGISCMSATACTAVGYAIVPSETGCLQPGQCYTTPASYTSFAERWDGNAWAVETVPNPSSQTQLLGVSCTSASSCTAVGRYYGAGGDSADTGEGGSVQYVTTLAERWNGTNWSSLGAPPPVDGWFAGVSCPSDADCFAAGGNGSPLAEEWNGTSWMPQIAPNPDPVSGGAPGLSSVSCTEATACTAVGGYYTVQTGGYFAGSAFAEQLNGGGPWRVQTIANPSGAADTQLASVSCRGGRCTAVGEYFTAPSNDEYAAAAYWNGEGWTVEKPPDPAGSAATSLHAVSCPTATTCTAVGTAGTGPNGTGTVLVEQAS